MHGAFCRPLAEIAVARKQAQEGMDLIGLGSLRHPRVRDYFIRGMSDALDALGYSGLTVSNAFPPGLRLMYQSRPWMQFTRAGATAAGWKTLTHLRIPERCLFQLSMSPDKVWEMQLCWHAYLVRVVFNCAVVCTPTLREGLQSCCCRSFVPSRF